MLSREMTRIETTFEMPVLSTDTILEPGLALQMVIEGGVSKVRKSNATANSIFAGIAWAQSIGANTTAPKYSTITVGAADSGGTGLALATLPVASTGTTEMTVIRGAGYGAATPLTPVAVGSVNAATKYSLDPDNITIRVDNTLAGTTLFVVQRYTPGAQDLLYRWGDMYLPTGPAAMGRIGVINRGEIYTSNFDTAVDWSTIDTYAAAEVVIAAANGRFSVNTTGAACRNAYVIGIPSASYPYLGLRLEM